MPNRRQASPALAAVESRPRPTRPTKREEPAVQRPEVVPFTALQEVGFATIRRNMAKRRRKA